MTDLDQLARTCGATTYTNRHHPGQPAFAFGPDAWAKFCTAVTGQDRTGGANKKGNPHRTAEQISLMMTFAGCSITEHQQNVLAAALKTLEEPT